MTVLRLDGNGINIISDFSFKNQYKLLWLDLSYNKIRLLEEKALNGLQILNMLDLSYNKLEKLDAVHFENNFLTQYGIVELKSLNLSGNHMLDLKILENALEVSIIEK